MLFLARIKEKQINSDQSKQIVKENFGRAILFLILFSNQLAKRFRIWGTQK